MHSSQHARDKLVDAITLLNQRHKRRDAALVVTNVPEVRKDQLLKLLNLVLQSHQVGNRLVPLIRVVDRLQTDVLLILERSVKLLVRMVERELRQDIVDVFVDQRAVSANTLAGHAALQAVDPIPVCHCLS